MNVLVACEESQAVCIAKAMADTWDKYSRNAVRRVLYDSPRIADETGEKG